MSADELLQSLFVVSRLSVNDKLVADGFRFSIRPPTYYRTFLRMYYNEGRSKNIDALRMVFALSMKGVVIHNYKSEHDDKTRFLDALVPACVGLRNLVETYRDDVEAVSKLQILIEDVESFVQTHRCATLQDSDPTTQAPTPRPCEVSVARPITRAISPPPDQDGFL